MATNNFIQKISKWFGNDSTNDNFKVFKQADGTYRWFAVVTNKFRDREREILTNKAHLEFLDYLNNNPDKAPEFWTWHTKGTAKTYRADWFDYANGFFMYSGIFTEEEAKPYINNSEVNEKIGMSHGFYVLEQKGNLILKYRTFEVSELPLRVAANEHTSFDMIVKENKKDMDSNKRAYLVSRLGEDVVSNIENNTEDYAKQLEEQGVDFKVIMKEYDEKVEADEKAEAKAKAEANETLVDEKADEKAKAIAAVFISEIVKSLDVDGLNSVLKNLQDEVELIKGLVPVVEKMGERVDHLMETEDVRMAKSISPVKAIWGNSSTSKETIVEKKDLDAGVLEQLDDLEDVNSWLKSLAPKGLGE